MNRGSVITKVGMMVMFALIPILSLEAAMRDNHEGIGNKILNPHVPLLPGLVWDFVGFPGLLAIPFFFYSYRAVRQTEQYPKAIWSLAIVLTFVIFRYGVFYIPLFYFGSVRIR